MNFNLDHKKLYILATSGGPDSMALADMLIKDGYHLILANVNYKTRKESDYEEELVKKFAKKHNQLFESAIYQDDQSKNSFEVKAREFRYSFFEKLYKKYNAEALIVAHHKDDVIETYLLKKKRNVINESYLILENNIIKGMNVYRPLVNVYYKDELLKYCNDNNIPYSIDITNFDTRIPRNKIREELKQMDKEEIYKKALHDEQHLQETRNQVKEYLSEHNRVLINDLKDKDYTFLSILLYEMAQEKYKLCVNKALVLKLIDFIKSQKPNIYFNIKDNYYLIKEYNEIYCDSIDNNQYSYTLNKGELINPLEFKIVDSGIKMHGVPLLDSDYPITLRSYNQDDTICLKAGRKKISRLFIDKKIPVYKRNKILIIENVNKEIIFVYGLYRLYSRKSSQNTFYVIQ